MKEDFIITDDGILIEYKGNDEVVEIPHGVGAIGNRKTDKHIYGAFEQTKIKEVIIPDTVTSIDASAFMSCSGLQSITIPDSVTLIDDFAFLGCTNLRKITIPDSVKSIGEQAFAFCHRLKNIKIPESVTSIGKMAFSDCMCLDVLYIPDSVQSIGEKAFAECNRLDIVVSKNCTFPINTFAGCYDVVITKNEWYYK